MFGGIMGISVAGKDWGINILDFPVKSQILHL